jgi:hypothetical protein
MRAPLDANNTVERDDKQNATSKITTTHQSQNKKVLYHPILMGETNLLIILCQPCSGGKHRLTLCALKFPHKKDTTAKAKTVEHMLIGKESAMDGLHPPHLAVTKGPVTGKNKDALQKENKERRMKMQMAQPDTPLWSTAMGQFFLPENLSPPSEHRNRMCPSGLALMHPAKELLQEWATLGCPTMMGRLWTVEEMTTAIA